MSDKPVSPFKFYPNQIEGILNLDNSILADIPGRVTDSFRYRIEIGNESVSVTETTDVSLNGRTGSTQKIVLSGNYPVIAGDPEFKNQYKGNFDNLSEENKEIVKNALLNNSIRDEAYVKKYNKLIKEAEGSNKGSEFREALEANGNLKFIEGNESFSGTEVKTKKINDQEISDQKDKDNEIELQEYRELIQVGTEDLAYPPHLKGNNGEDYIFIEQFEYSPPQPEKTNSLGEVLETGAKRKSNIKNIETRRGSCRLPIPNKLGVSNGVSWGEARANAVELAAFQSASGSIGGLLGGETNIGELIKGGVGDAGNIFNKIKEDFKNTGGSEANSASVISAVLARSALSQIGINVDVDQFITRETGAAINPNLELLFGGPQLRTFSFNFNFAPESPDEALAVRKIQRWFKQGMLPTKQTVALNSSLFLGSPNVFKIQYKNKTRRIKGLNIIKICALTSCQVDFTPDGTYQSYGDSDAVSMPVRSTMGLSFNELTPIFRDDYLENSEDPSLQDLGMMLKGADAINENDIGF